MVQSSCGGCSPGVTGMGLGEVRTTPLLCRSSAHRVGVSEGARGGEEGKLRRSQSHMEGGVARIEEKRVGRGLTEGFLRIRLLDIQF